MDGKTVGIVVAAIIIIAGGWYFLMETPEDAPVNTDQASQTSQTPATASTTTTTTTTTTTVAAGTTVIYSAQGFTPKSITVSVGTTVRFINQSSGSMWVASAMHPTHTAYGGTSLSQHCPDTTNSAFDQCVQGAPGSIYSFTFNKAGTWNYHDHIDASKFGTVVVTAP